MIEQIERMIDRFEKKKSFSQYQYISGYISALMYVDVITLEEFEKYSQKILNIQFGL